MVDKNGIELALQDSVTFDGKSGPVPASIRALQKKMGNWVAILDIEGVREIVFDSSKIEKV